MEEKENVNKLALPKMKYMIFGRKIKEGLEMIHYKRKHIYLSRHERSIWILDNRREGAIVIQKHNNLFSPGNGYYLLQLL